MWGRTGFCTTMSAALIALGMLTSGSLAMASSTSNPPPAAADSTAIIPQRDLFDVIHEIFKGPKLESELRLKPRRGLAWVALPSLSYNPLYGVAVGASASAAGPLGDPETTRISSISVGGNYSTTKQLQAHARGDVFLSSNELLLRMDARYLDTSRPTWGLGPVVADQQEYMMDYEMSRFHFTAFREVGSDVYAGLGFHYDTFFNVVDQRAAAGESTPYTDYSTGPLDRSASTGISVNLLNDVRDNPVNPRRGYYLNSSFRAYTQDDGGENWQEMMAEFRSYPGLPIGSRNRLCFWMQTWFTFGKTPYLNLPHIAGDTYNRSGRGYVIGRIRSQSMFTTEVEYRFDLRQDGLLGAVAFMSLTSATEPESGVFGRANLAGGGGLRIKFNKRSDTNLTIDAGWGEQGSFGMFLGTTEAF